MEIKRRLNLLCMAALLFLLFSLSCSLICVKEEITGKELPIYTVSSTGITQDKARALGKALGFSEEIINNAGFLNEDGVVAFLDSKLYLNVPTKKLGPGKPDEHGNKTVIEAFDFEAMKNTKILAEEPAISRFEQALKKSGISLAEAKARSGQSIFEVVDSTGKLMKKIQLDTRVYYNFSLNGIPITGPGSKISASFAGSGRVTRLRCAIREIKGGDLVPILPSAEIKQRLIKQYQQCLPEGYSKDIRLKTKLVYYAPSLSFGKAEIIIPFYECSGTAYKGKEKIVLLDELVPAVQSNKYVPEVRLDARVEGAKISATVTVKGGTPPYRTNWSGMERLPGKSGRQISYVAKSRKTIHREVVTVTVTDANGIFVKAAKSLIIDPQAFQEIQFPRISKIGGIRDFGTENAVTNQFGDLEEGFVDEMLDDGVQMRFRWWGLAAWEQDFKAPEDTSWIDNTDITFYVGHGDGDGFTFENTTQDDSKLDYNDADGDWGDYDLEWLALYSCQVLEDSWGGMNRFDRWRQEFDGLHLLLGFHTNAQANFGFSRAFARNLVDVPMTVLNAWFDAIDSDQPSDRVGVVMGVFRSGDGATNSNDYFWGKGSVGPDIRGSSIGGYWTIKIY